MAEEFLPKIRVQEQGSVGRTYFANESLTMGTPILSETPFGAVLINDDVIDSQTHGICCVCFKIHVKRMQRGLHDLPQKSLDYCSSECQEQGRNQQHHFIYGNAMDALVARAGTKTLRLLAWFLVNASDPTEMLPKLQHEPQFPSVPSYKNELKYVEELVELIVNKGYEGKLCTKEILLKRAMVWYGRIYVNSFAIRWNSYGPPLGLAMYERASMFNHSCSPTALAYFSGNKLEVRLTEDVDKDAEITISFMQHLESQPCSKRQEALKTNFAFLCKCERCMSGELFHNNTLEKRLGSQISAAESKHVNLMNHAKKLWQGPVNKRSGPLVSWRFYKKCWEKYHSEYTHIDPDVIWMFADLVEKAFALKDWQTGMEVCTLGLKFTSRLMMENFTRNAVQAELFFAFYNCVFCIETIPPSFFKLKRKQLKKKIQRGALVDDLLVAIEGSTQFVAALSCIFQDDIMALEGWFGDITKVDPRFERTLHWLKFMHSTLRQSPV